MSDPRKHQKTPHPGRQPAAEPFRGPAQERPFPSEHPVIEAPVDEAAADARSKGRPVRMLEPSQQAPVVEFERTLRKGESYWIVGHREVPRPRKAKIIRISNEPGKAVGVEFDEPIGGRDERGQPWGVVHTCDGRGKAGHCLYIRPDQVLDEQAMDAHRARQAEVAEDSPYEDYEEMTVNPGHSQPITPMSAPGGNGGPLGLEDLAEGKEEAEDTEDR